MKKLIENVESSLANNHVSWPIFIGIGLEVASIFWPDHKDQFAQVQRVLISYGVLAAANSLPSASPTNKP